MSEREPILSALTPQEWLPSQGRITVDSRGPRGKGLSFAAAENGGEVAIADEGVTAAVPEITVKDPRDKHALAALCLHGHPFGFERKKLMFFRGLVSVLAKTGKIDEKDVDLFEWHIERIEALLPPATP